MVNNFTRNI